MSNAATSADRRHWLVKSEPTSFSFDDLLAVPGCTTVWDGVRNYQARNYMRDDMRPGDGVLFYHSNGDPTGVAGLAEVAAAARPDLTAFDPEHPGYDAKSRPDVPTWVAVEVRAVERFPAVVSLSELRADPACAGLQVLRRGNRLSVTPVSEAEWNAVCRLGRRDAAGSGRA
ncbi:EVE domain-containing protein [Gemmatimonadetes bacterium T265]|nr:EVE domain-containing protein [Gemmatimonadetes bacterium T265]